MKFSGRCFLAFLCVAASTGILPAQKKYVDSLRNALSTAKEDTGKVKLLDDLSFALYSANPDTTILLAQQALELSNKLDWKNGVALTYNRMGIGYQVKGDYTKALDCYQQSLKISREMGNRKVEANNLSNIGLLYYSKGDYNKGLDYYQKALIIFAELGNKKGMAGTLGNIGGIYHEQGDFTNALEYDLKALKAYEDLGNKQGQATHLGNIGLIYKDEAENIKALDYIMRALKLYQELDNKEGQARNLGNLGSVYQNMGDNFKAIDYGMKALKINEEMGNKQGQANDLGNIAVAYKIKGDYDKALEYNQRAMAIFEEIGDKRGLAGVEENIGSLFLKTGKFKEAEEYLKKAIVLDSTIGEKNQLRVDETTIAKLYDTTGRYKPALYWFKEASVLKDTLFNIDKDKALTRKELTFKFTRQQDSARDVQDKKDAVHEAEVKSQRTVIYSISTGLLLVVLLALTIFRALQMNRKQKAEVEKKNILIEQQKAEVEKKNEVIAEKNKDIIDSITYAKRLQDAIIPSLTTIKKHLPDSFVLYKPKDIVAGDFYWMEHLPLPEGEGRGEVVLFAACDCTGHGVPGAMVSVVCSNALNRALKEFRIYDTARLLDKVREIVLETFEKSEGEVKDGMDCSFCAINTKTNEVEWSGANNPLWFIQNGEFKELNPDKQPVGVFDNSKPFNKTTLKLGKGDSLYLFTDGYADQFGGPKGKKFKYKQLQDLIVASAKLKMEDQKQVMEKAFEDWKGTLEQTDDVCVIGIRI